MIRGDALSIGALVDIMQPYAGGSSGPTLNPSDISNGSLSNNNLTFTSSAVLSGVRSTTSHSSGKFYVTFTTTTDNQLTVGFANSSYTLGASFVGVDNNSLGENPSGNIFLNGSSLTNFGPGHTNGSVVGMAVDFTGQTVQFNLNGGSLSTANSFSTMAAGPYFVVIGTDFGASGNVCTVNFAPASPPTGFGPW